MPELPVLKPKEVVRAFERMGYIQQRQKGSHCILIRERTPQQIVVPIHGGDVKKGTLRAIIRQSGKTVEEFLTFLV